MTEPLPLFRQQALAARSGIDGAVLVNRTRLSWVLTIICGSLLIVGIIAAALVELPRVQRAPTIAVSTISPAKVVAPRPGRIVSIEVREGQQVRAGDVIARITNSQDEEAATRDEIERAAAEQAAQLAGQQVADQEGADRAELLDLDAQLRTAENQNAVLVAQLDDRRQGMEIAEEEFRNIESVASRGFISKSERNRRWLALLEQRAEFRETSSKLSTSTEEIAKLKRKIARFGQDARLRQFEAQSDQLTALARSRASKAGDRFIIRAPVAGIVSTVVVGSGAAVGAGGTLATIVPSNSPIQAVLYVSSASIGQIKKGQRVQLRFDSFPFQEYGSFGGKIVDVSPSVVLPGEAMQFFNLKEPSFKVVAAIETRPRRARNVVAGMTGEALIVTGERGFFGSLLR